MRMNNCSVLLIKYKQAIAHWQDLFLDVRFLNAVEGINYRELQWPLCDRDKQTQCAMQTKANAGLSLGLRPAKKRRRYFVTTFLIGWVQA